MTVFETGLFGGETASPVFSIYLGDGNPSEFWDEPIDLVGLWLSEED